MQLMSATEFQAQNFKLRNREYKYYFEANKSRLDRVPDLSDSSGGTLIHRLPVWCEKRGAVALLHLQTLTPLRNAGLSNPAYFNFVYYIAWKIVARSTTPLQRDEFNRLFGCRLYGLLIPGAAERLVASKELSTGAFFCTRDYPVEYLCSGDNSGYTRNHLRFLVAEMGSQIQM
jgi:hypothetical protein